MTHGTVSVETNLLGHDMKSTFERSLIIVQRIFIDYSNNNIYFDNIYLFIKLAYCKVAWRSLCNAQENAKG